MDPGLPVPFSRGLGAPVGSILCGPRAFIARARSDRRALGGGMRQVGVLAALDGWRDRLTRDHDLATRLSEGLEATNRFEVVPPDTNIVLARHREGPDPQREIVDDLAEEGYLAISLGPIGIRFVTHRDVDEAAVEGLLGALGDPME